MGVGRFLVTLGLAIALIGLVWPWLSKLGLGRLPGDIVAARGQSRFYFPIVTCLVLSLVASLVLWVFRR
ncbi:MAG: DUF2905 domain-containing protein [Gammaproteobacteria bacterium]|nr:DUF2905 domain-containing protein [Gammaproteobacteria bacterium]